MPNQWTAQGWPEVHILCPRPEGPTTTQGPGVGRFHPGGGGRHAGRSTTSTLRQIGPGQGWAQESAA